MTSEEIRGSYKVFIKQFDRATTAEALAMGVESSKLEILIEIAAQLADLNETLKAKSLTAYCDAHVHIGKGGDSLAGWP